MSEEVQTFRATNGRVTGGIGLALCLVVAVLFVATDTTSAAVSGVLGCGFAAVLVWTALLRPRVTATARELRMRTLSDEVTIPLASIDTVTVRRYLLVRSGGVKYICPAISRSLRKTVRNEMKWQGGAQMLSPGLQPNAMGGPLQTEVAGKGVDYADFVESQIIHLANVDRADRGIEARSEEEYELGSQVTHRRAWLELGALVVLGAAFVLSFVL